MFGFAITVWYIQSQESPILRIRPCQAIHLLHFYDISYYCESVTWIRVNLQFNYQQKIKIAVSRSAFKKCIDANVPTMNLKYLIGGVIYINIIVNIRYHNANGWKLFKTRKNTKADVWTFTTYITWYTSLHTTIIQNMYYVHKNDSLQISTINKV